MHNISLQARISNELELSRENEAKLRDTLNVTLAQLNDKTCAYTQAMQEVRPRDCNEVASSPYMVAQ